MDVHLGKWGARINGAVGQWHSQELGTQERREARGARRMSVCIYVAGISSIEASMALQLKLGGFRVPGSQASRKVGGIRGRGRGHCGGGYGGLSGGKSGDPEGV